MGRSGALLPITLLITFAGPLRVGRADIAAAVQSYHEVQNGRGFALFGRPPQQWLTPTTPTYSQGLTYSESLFQLYSRVSAGYSTSVEKNTLYFNASLDTSVALLDSGSFNILYDYDHLTIGLASSSPLRYSIVTSLTGSTPNFAGGTRSSSASSNLHVGSNSGLLLPSGGTFLPSGGFGGTYVTGIVDVDTRAAGFLTSEGTTSISSSLSVTAAFQEMPAYANSHHLEYFGIGTDWSNSGLYPMRGDLNASNLRATLQRNAPTFGSGTVVTLKATDAPEVNKLKISSQFGQFMNTVGANDTAVFYVASHGGVDSTLGPIIATSDNPSGTLTDGDVLRPQDIKSYLSMLPPSAMKIVILESCDAAAFSPVLTSLPNVSVMTARNGSKDADGEAFVVRSGSAPEAKYGVGTSMFTDALQDELDRGVFDLNQIQLDLPGLDIGLIGQDMFLEGSGTSVFQGYAPGLFASDGFNGDLLGPAVSIPELGSFSCLCFGAFALRRRARSATSSAHAPRPESPALSTA